MLTVKGVNCSLEFTDAICRTVLEVQLLGKTEGNNDCTLGEKQTFEGIFQLG